MILLSIYTYKTETFEAPTDFHVSIIFKKKKNVIKLFKIPTLPFPFPKTAFPFHEAMPKAKPAPQIPDLHI